MAYVSLYRRYRPQTFAEVIGQQHVIGTLTQAIAEDRLHHAHLFTGPRGTGKTSTARILAKAVNCIRGPTPEPCNACEQCRSITEGSSVDVVEIDAASHGGVDDVRELRERVAFVPASARMKVYIVDECHMLSTAGWNAFLKTVEEPPGHVIFVFATTEPHKVLETILSRTQRFDFKRIGSERLAEYLLQVAGHEGIAFDSDTAELIARAGDGSVRDALSLLEQVVAFTGPKVTVEGVAEVLGSTDEQLLGEMAGFVAAGDVPGLCLLVQRLADEGHDLRQFARDATDHLRTLFMLQTAPGADLVTGTPDRLERLQAQAARLGRVELLRAVELLAECQAQMRRGNTRLPLEIALIKAALPEASGDPAALAARIDRLERRLREPSPDTDPSPPATRAGASTRRDGNDPPPATEFDLELLQRSWPAVLDRVKEQTIRVHALLQMSTPIGLEDGVLTLEFRAGHAFHAEQCGSDEGQRVIGGAIHDVVGVKTRLRCVVARAHSIRAGVEGARHQTEAEAVAETEALEAAGALPEEEEAHRRAIDALRRGLGATVVDDGEDSPA